MSCSITTHLAFVCCLRWRVPKMTCHLLQHFMLVSPGGILVITLSGLLVKISFDPNLLDGNLPGRQVALPPSHLCRFRQPLWPLLSPLVENDQIPDQIRSGWWTIEVTCSKVFLLAFRLTYSSNSSGFAFSSRDISAYWASSPATKTCFCPTSSCPRFFSLTAREVNFEASLWPPPPLFPHDASWLFWLYNWRGRNSDVCFRPVAGQNLRDGDWGQVEDCVREESMRSGNLCEQIWLS